MFKFQALASLCKADSCIYICTYCIYVCVRMLQIYIYIYIYSIIIFLPPCAIAALLRLGLINDARHARCISFPAISEIDIPTAHSSSGYVMGTEQRALSNIGASRFHPDHKNPVCLTAFGPNINIVRDPRFGRNSELASEDPLLSGTYAVHMVEGMQQRDEKGYKKTAAYLKHYTAYSTEANRGHDTRDT